MIWFPCGETAGYASLSPQIYAGTHIITLVVTALSLTLPPVLFYPVWICEMTQQTPQNILIYGFLFWSKGYVLGRECTSGVQETLTRSPWSWLFIYRMCLMCLELSRSVQGISLQDSHQWVKLSMRGLTNLLIHTIKPGLSNQLG